MSGVTALSTLSPAEQVLLAAMFIVSVGLAASVVQGVLSSVASREILMERTVTRRIRHAREHVIVAGYNHLRRYAVKWLTDGFLIS